MATFKRFEDIVVWQLGRQLVRQVYALTRKGLFAGDYGLKDQIQRAAVSVPSNIAEGFERDGNKDFVKSLYIAKGSVGEVRSQIYNAVDLGYVTEDEMKEIQDAAMRIAAGLLSLIQSLSTSQRPGRRYESPQPCNPATLQLCNLATLQLCTPVTLHTCNPVTLQLCNFLNP